MWVNVDTALLRRTEWVGIRIDKTLQKVYWLAFSRGKLDVWLTLSIDSGPNLLTASIYSTKVNGRSWSQNEGYGWSARLHASPQEVRSSLEIYTTSRNRHVLKSTVRKHSKLIWKEINEYWKDWYSHINNSHLCLNDVVFFGLSQTLYSVKGMN